MDDQASDVDVAELWKTARMACSGVELPCEAFAKAVRRLREEGHVLIAADEAIEMYLACACARGDTQALASFEEQYVSAIPATLARMHLSAADVSEVQQVLRRRLLVGEDGPPKLLQYAGRGSLKGLVRVVATRIALDLLRRQEREVLDPEEDLLRLPVGTDDPELRAIKQQHRTEFRLAFEEALALLSKRQRTLLRLHCLDGVQLHNLATSYGVNRATVVRWIAAAKKQLLTSTRRILTKHLGLDQDELASLARIIESHFDVSLRRLLETQEPSTKV